MFESLPIARMVDAPTGSNFDYPSEFIVRDLGYSATYTEENGIKAITSTSQNAPIRQPMIYEIGSGNAWADWKDNRIVRIAVDGEPGTPSYLPAAMELQDDSYCCDADRTGAEWQTATMLASGGVQNVFRTETGNRVILRPDQGIHLRFSDHHTNQRVPTWPPGSETTERNGPIMFASGFLSDRMSDYDYEGPCADAANFSPQNLGAASYYAITPVMTMGAMVYDDVFVTDDDGNDSAAWRPMVPIHCDQIEYALGLNYFVAALNAALAAANEGMWSSGLPFFCEGATVTADKRIKPEFKPTPA